MGASQIAWIFSFALTFLLFYLSINHLQNIHNAYDVNISQLNSKEKVDFYLNNHWQRSVNPEKNQPIPIPTGLFVQSIDWIDANTYYISGYLWQKYPERAKGKISEGFVLPEAVELEVKESYRWPGQGFETVGWFFEGKITQKLDYSKYPFDHKNVRIRLWHSDFDQRAILVPDLDGYDSTKENEKFGIDPEIVLGGFDIQETFFHYDHLNYDANFGASTKGQQKKYPELFFNIVLKRNALNAMIINVLPLLIVVILCFSSLLSITFDEAKREIYNFRFLEILTQVGALFFVIVLAHIHLREILAGVGIVYLEYIYVISYIGMIYVALNAYLVVHAELTDYKIYSIIKYQDNLIPKILFLPLFSLGTYLVSMRFF